MQRSYFKTLINTFNYVVHDYWVEMSDPRTAHLFLMDGGPWKVIALMICYVVFAKIIGPQLMKNRKPFRLTNTLLAYNISMMLINVYFFTQTIYYLNYGLELMNFQFPDKNNLTKFEYDKAFFMYQYFWTKVVDLMDTMFFVLRKKQSQITGLHLYHHSTLPVLGWLTIKTAPTSPCVGLFPLINTLMHVIMYLYYALSALGPKVQRYLWWKKYITQLQMAQFAIYGVYTLAFIRYQTGYPLHLWFFIGFPQPFVFFYLFWSFYRSSYRKMNHKNIICVNNNKVSQNNNNNDYVKRNALSVKSGLNNEYCKID